MTRAPEVIFSISGPAVEPAQLTRLLGVSPSESTPAGTTIGTDLDGSEVEVEHLGSWVLSTGDRVDSPAAEAHVEYVLALLRPHVGALRALANEAELELFLRLPAGTRPPYPRYREFEAAVRALGAGIDFEAAAAGGEADV
jgi:hypothetical protein